MKNRFLRFTFVAFLTGITSFLMAAPIEDEQGVSVDKSKKMTSSEYFTAIRSNQITGQINIDDVLQARQAIKSLKSVNEDLTWESMGPNNFGGPTKAIIFDNQDASGNTLYAGSTSGGVWKSMNYGAIWEQVAIDDVLNVSSICQDGDGTVYVSTGVSLEPASDKIAEGSTIGKGIFKQSGDGFVLMEGTAPVGGEETDWAFIQKIAVDGNGALYAATNTGLKYYNGSQWDYAKVGTEDLLGKSCDVVIEGDVIITAVAGNTYVSTSGAAGFVLKSEEIEGMLPIGNFGNIKFAISKKNNDYIYASYVDDNGSLFNTYASVDKGDTWRVVYPGGSSLGDIFEGQGLRNNSITVDPLDEKKVYIGAHNLHKGYEAQSSGYYSWQQVSNGGSTPYPPVGESFFLHYGINTIVFNPYTSGHVVFGTDGGIGATKNNFNSIVVLNRKYNTTEYFTINADKFGIVLGGSQFNGVHRIEDNGSQQAIEMLKNNYVFPGPSAKTGGYNHISFINNEFYVCSAEDGTFWRSEDGGVNTDILAGITLKTGNEFITPFLLWESQNNPLSNDSVEFEATKDYNEGDILWGISNNYEYPFKTVAAQNIDDGQTLMIRDLVSTKAFFAVEGLSKGEFEGGVYMATGMLDYTAAPDWWQIGAVEGIPTCMAYSSDANYLWVGTLEGRLFRLSNIARAYNKDNADISSPGCIIANTEVLLETTQAITSLSVDPKDAQNVLFTLGNYGNSDYVFASTDGMSDDPSFESIQGNLPTMPVYASSFEINNSGLVVLGTENGLFSTENFDDSNVEWALEDTPFGNVPVFAIKQQNIDWSYVTYPVNDEFNLYYPGANNYGAFYIGTFGSGVYVSKDFVGFKEFNSVDANEKMLEIYPNPARQLARIAFESSTQGMVDLEIYDLSGKLVISRQYGVNKGQATIDVNVIDLDSGSYIVRVIDANNHYQSKIVITK